MKPVAIDPADDPRLIQALEDYEAACLAGQRPDRREFLARHEAVAGPLAQALDGMEFLHGSAPELLARAAPAPATLLPVPEMSQAPLGDFRLVRELGRGGMGVVYEAMQLSLGRRVALKVLPFAAGLDPRQLQRFKNEAQAAANLQHPHIVPVYYVGCERGVHFYAMQLIDGPNLAKVIADRWATHSSCLDVPSGTERENTRPDLAAQLSTQRAGQTDDFFRTAARLAAQAAEGLEYAHGIGIVHRDVKPANLLVDERGQVWLTDFGLAHFHADVALTLTGDVLGTLRYMSPEQAGGQRVLIDHRTDVYSLGATLYELLTLRPIFDGADRQTLLRQIMYEEPRPPRALDRSIPLELETIVLKAVAKHPAERYATAGDLADDLHRFLRHEPIRARRPTLRERAARWSRRHKSVVAAALAALVLLAVALAASTVLIAREQANTRSAYDRLAEEQVRTEAAYQAELRNFQQARRMLDFFAQVSAEELADKPDAQEVRRKLLQAALEYYQDFIKNCPDDPSTREELARSHLGVANLLNGMGATADALAALEQAHRVLETKPDAELERLSALRLNWLKNGGPLLLLEQPSVQQELSLSTEQARQVARLSARRRAAFWDSHDLSLERWRTKFEELAAQEKDVLGGLGPEQARRLKQIAWQEGGASAFSDPELLSALTLSDEQRRRIEAILDAARRAARAGNRFGPPRPEDWKKAEEQWRKTRDQVLDVLSAEQQQTWRELTGEPFKGEVRLPFPSSFGLRPRPWVPKKP